MTGCRDLKPEQLAELEQAMYRAQAEVRGDAASIAKPWPLRRVSYGDLPVNVAAYCPSPWLQGMGDMAKKKAALRVSLALLEAVRKARRQQRRDRWTIAICCAVLAAPGVVALVRWVL